MDEAAWRGSDTYTQQEHLHKRGIQPWLLDGTECVLHCKDGYWSNEDSVHNKSADPLDQRCTSDNCKDWDYDLGSVSITPAPCKTCWDKDDVATWGNWDGRLSYTEKEMEGKDPNIPFGNISGTSECKLQCDTGYWSNWESNA
jgi:hypothetical protein